MAFRRLAYHRSWFMIVVGTIGLASIVGNSTLLRWNPPEDLVYLAVLGSAVTALMIVRGFTGSWSKRQVRVDVAAGKLQLPDGSLYDLDALGELTIEKKAVPRLRGSRPGPQLHEYLLRAAHLKYYLFDSVYESETKLRYDAVTAAVLQSRLRKILERPSGDGSAFRSGPDVADEIRATFPERERTVAALDALTRDPDAHIRAQATKLAAAIRSSSP